MGAVYPGIPRSLAQFIKNEYNLSVFVETGTFMAATAVWASGEFKEVYTIELSSDYYGKAIKKYGNIKNIKFLQGSSAVVLNDLLSKDIATALFWLDAHYSGLDTAGENERCPLINEIESILKSSAGHVILIDDARGILAAPPDDIRNINDMPSLKEVMDVLNSFTPRYSIIWRDVIISVPDHKKEIIYRFINSQGDLFFFDPKPDFANEGVGVIANYWKKAVSGLFFLPGAICRSLKARIS